MRGFQYMLAQAKLPQVAEPLGMLKGLPPIRSTCQEDGNRSSRFDFHVDVAAICAGVIGPSGMVISRIQPQTLVIGGKPVERSLLAKRRHRERESQQKREKKWSCVSDNSSFESRPHFHLQALFTGVFVGSILPGRTVSLG
jgi:hypothetical protein